MWALQRRTGLGVKQEDLKEVAALVGMNKKGKRGRHSREEWRPSGGKRWHVFTAAGKEDWGYMDQDDSPHPLMLPQVRDQFQQKLLEYTDSNNCRLPLPPAPTGG